MAYWLGVDLGTTFTAAAVASGSEPSMVGLGNRALQVPSVLYLGSDGFLVGEAAERRGAVDPSRVVREFKRRIGDPVPLLVGGVSYSAEALGARLLRWVVDQATQRLGEPPVSVILTHPANWGPYKLHLLDQLTAMADVRDALRCPEPVAAAVQYAARSKVPIGARVAVYDLGGGTFDVCVLEKTSREFRICGAPEGVEHLGGVDFDEAIFRYVLEHVGGSDAWMAAETPEFAVGLARLRRDCVEAKEALSTDTDVVLPVSLPGHNGTVRLTRRALEGLIRPAIDETLSALDRTLRSAGGALDAIVLVGGSSRIPLVAELVTRRFGVPAAIDAHPKHDIALGAVRWAASAAAASQQVAAPPVFVPPAEATAAPVVEPNPATSTRPAVISPPEPAAADSLRRAQGASAEPPRAPRPGARGGDSLRQAQGASARAQGPSAQAPGGTVPAAGSGDALPHAQGVSVPIPRTPRTRRRILIATGAAAALAGVGIATAIYLGPRPAVRSAATGSSSPTASSANTAPSPVDDLPRSAPLADTQMIVPMNVHGNWDLYLADTRRPGPLKRLTRQPAAEYGQVLSPDRRTVVYLHDDDVTDSSRTLWVAGSADGSDARPLFRQTPAECDAMMYRPAWSRTDPTLLAVPCTNSKGHFGLYLIRTNGTLVKKLPVPGRAVDDPAFSWDGRQLVYWAGPDPEVNGGALYLVTLDGTAPRRQLTFPTRAGEDGDPIFAPDGRTVVFRRRLPEGTNGWGSEDLYVVPTDGSAGPRPLVQLSGDEEDPTFSPDGTRIAFQSTTPTQAWPGAARHRAWVAEADGDNPQVLWTSGAPDQQVAPAWSAR